MQSNQQNHIQMVAIFRPGDPFRGIVRQYAVAAGGRLFVYEHPCQALSRMPVPDGKRPLAVVCRAETLSEDIAAALASLAVPDRTYYLLCLDPGDKPTTRPSAITADRIYTITDREELGSAMRHIAPDVSSTQTPQKYKGLSLPDEPLTDDEMDALLGRI